MKSLKELYRIGPGPSSSHTLGPQRAASLFKERYPNAHHYEVELFGSLALTGKGHLTDYIIIETMKPKECVVLFKNRRELKHPNTMQLSAYDEADRLLGEWTVYSIGGGAIQIEGEKRIIGGYADKFTRERLASELGAELIFINEDIETCLYRLKYTNDYRQNNYDEWKVYIEKWFEDYIE